jgi:hypothetical protein
MSKIYGASIAHVHVKQPAKVKKAPPASRKPEPVEVKQAPPVAVKELPVQPAAAHAPKPEVPKVENANVPKPESK